MHFTLLMQANKSSTTRERTRRSMIRSSVNALDVSIFDLLIADHRAVAGVFAELKKEIEADEPDAATCRELFMKVDALLTPHARAEEELVYPAFAAGSDEAQGPVAEGYEEHALVHQLCAQIKELPEVDHVWCAKAKVLMDLVEHHVREEEGEQFTAARKVVSKEEQAALAAEFLAGKERIAAELGLPAPETLELPPPARSKPAAA